MPLRALGLVLALTVAAPITAGAKPTREAVESRLRAHEVAASAADWRALGDGVDAVLVAVAADARADLLMRARALSALGFFPTPRARRHLESVIDANGRAADRDARLLVRKAAMALGWMGGPTAPARIGPLLENDDAEVRLDAAIALGLTRLKSAADILRKRVDSEPAANVRAQIGRQIRIIDDALAAATAK